jgi:outer membrane scaffolding protein for murein synthesis (MipA/OmpV family)
MTRRRLRAAATLLGALAVTAQARESLPLWELGLGVAALRLPHYRGSDQSRNWLLPLPYVVYRGRIFKADRDGARAVLFESDRLDFDLSAFAAAPTNSDRNVARQGMRDLAPTFEIGPNLRWTAARGDGWKLDLRLPVRAALTIEAHPHAIGWVAAPNLNLDLPKVGGSGFDLGLLAGPLYGTRLYHGYFYDVTPAVAIATLPAYRAPGGAAGNQVTAALSRRLARSWLGLFVRHDSLRGASFEASPLVRRREQLSFGVALSWVFATSQQTVVTP